MTKTCQHPGCTQSGERCEVSNWENPENPIIEWYCIDHKAEAGYCIGCGIFSAGIETFDFVHPGWCDNCWDQIRADEDYYDEDGLV